jgi:hypothetical protein
MLLLPTEMVCFSEIHVFLQLSWIGLFGIKSPFPHLELCLQEVFLAKTNSTLKGNNVLDAPPLTQMVSFQETGVFLQLSCIGLFGANRDYLYLENCLEFSIRFKN